MSTPDPPVAAVVRYSIYCHTNISSQKRYVGLTQRSVRTRWQQHVSSARLGRRSRFASAILAHGAGAFVSEVLEVVDTIEAAAEAERWWIAHFGSNLAHLGYNATAGGASAKPTGPEWRHIYSERAKAREAAMTPEKKSERAMRGLAGLPPEQRREIARRREANLSPSKKAARTAAMVAGRKPRPKKPKPPPKKRPPRPRAPPIVREKVPNLTKEQRRQVFLAREARKTPAERSEAVRKGHLKRTAAQRAAAVERLNAGLKRRGAKNPAQLDLFGGAK